MAFKLCRRLLRRCAGLGPSLWPSPWASLWPSPWASLGRRLTAGALAAIFVLQPWLAHAEEAGRRAVLVVDANTGRTLYQSGADSLRHPASLTKLMTLYILFELIEQGRLTLSSTITFSANAAGAPPSGLDVEAGAEITVGDAIKALIVKSANDVAVAVAEHIAGSEAAFAQLMNRKAEELGMKSTEFHNASGLPDTEQVTTARDMVTLALRLYDRFPRFYPLFAMRTFTWGSETYRSHNTLLFHYRGLEGLKTGYIRASGFNLVAAARRGKKHVFVAYFGGKTAALRNAAVRAHLDAGFAKAAEQRTRRPLAVAVEGPSADEKAKSEPVGGEAKGGTVAGLPAPLPAKRAATADGIEIARVRPVRVGAPDTKPKLSPRAEPAAEDDDEAPTLTPTLTPKGAFHVQIGAYQTKDEAKRQLASVSERAGTVLGDHAAYTSQVKRGDKTFFRARYVGFAAHASAADVCSELKLMEIDCLVMKAE